MESIQPQHFQDVPAPRTDIRGSESHYPQTLPLYKEKLTGVRINAEPACFQYVHSAVASKNQYIVLSHIKKKEKPQNYTFKDVLNLHSSLFSRT